MKLAKMGRPKAENPKDIKMSLRMDGQDSERLEEICKMTGDSKMESVRKAIKKYHEFLKKG